MSMKLKAMRKIDAILKPSQGWYRVLTLQRAQLAVSLIRMTDSDWDLN